MAYRKGHNNYGTSLQGYALLQVLRQLGCDVEIFDYVKRPNFKQKVEWVVNAIRVGEKNVLYRRLINKGGHNQSKNVENFALRTKAVDAYKEKKFQASFERYVGYEDLCNGSRKYDVVMVGSDQVWTPMGLPSKFFNLLFVDDSVRKIAYASSFGVSEIPEFQKEQTGHYLDRFYKIGVREQRGKEIVESLSRQTAQVVADPTLLLTREEWKREFCEDISVSSAGNRERAEKGGYIFCYFLGTNPDARKAAQALKEQTGLKIIAIRHMDEFVEADEQFGDEAPYAVDPNDFVRYIAHADYVCTDSFHCTVFSIIFHRRFMTFYRFAQASKTGRNSRIDSLFQVVSIPRCHIYQGDISAITDPIEWDKTDLRLSELRERSLQFLQDALKCYSLSNKHRHV